MTKLVCDKCGRESPGMHILSLKYKGEPRIGGGSMTLDGRIYMPTHKQGRCEIDLCSNCVDEVVNAIIPVLACGDNNKDK